jgi:hypothetical protein
MSSLDSSTNFMSKALSRNLRGKSNTVNTKLPRFWHTQSLVRKKARKRRVCKSVDAWAAVSPSSTKYQTKTTYQLLIQTSKAETFYRASEVQSASSTPSTQKRINLPPWKVRCPNPRQQTSVRTLVIKKKVRMFSLLRIIVKLHLISTSNIWYRQYSRWFTYRRSKAHVFALQGRKCM